MVQLYFVRDGSGEHHTSRGHPVAIDTAKDVALRLGTRFSLNGPVINPGVASPFAAFRHVVIEISDSDVGGVFDRARYYWLPQLSPEEAQRLFAIQSINDG